MNENTKFESTDFRNILPRFTQDALKANQSLVDLPGRMAERKNATLHKLHWHGSYLKNNGSFLFGVRPG
jgi:hypothetical protein